MSDIELVTPFPPREYPSIFSWIGSFRDKLAIDEAPDDIVEFVELQRARELDHQTWGVLKNGELGGFISFEPVNVEIGKVQAIFKKSFWGHATTKPALNQALAQIFDSQAQDTIFFEPLERNHGIRFLVQAVGAKEIGIRKDQEGGGNDRAVFVLLRDEWEKGIKIDLHQELETVVAEEGIEKSQEANV